jgi:outer membrane protein assembly factor BamC
METDWNETHPQISDGLIRNTLTMATGNSYVAAERNKYRTRLEAAPNGGTYVFVSQKGMREALTGTNNEQSQWQAKPNDPALEGEYLKRLMANLALADARQASGQTGTTDAAMAAAAAASSPSAATSAQRAAQNATLAAQTPIKEDVVPEASAVEINLQEPYDRAWLRVGLALDRTNFTVDDRDRGRGIYFVRYVDPKDMTSAEQGFWNQVFHGKKEKLAKNYEVNVRALTETQTRVSIIDGKGDVDSSPQARQIMGLLDDQLH